MRAMSEARIDVTYRLQGAGGNAAARAQALALEQSIEMPAEAVRDARVLRDVVARVEAIEPQPDGSHLARLSLSVESVGDDAGQLMNMLFGNSSLHADVEVLDASLPAVLAAQFGGPNHGIAGVRARVGALSARALTCTALKPIGSTPADLAAMTATFARAGDNRAELAKAWQQVPDAQRSSLAFLLEHLPAGDATTLTAAFLLREVAQAHAARAAVPWGTSTGSIALEIWAISSAPPSAAAAWRGT
jgi:hypothetical protein